MYAVFIDGGRQYKVVVGEQVDLDYRDLPAGSDLKFDRVVALSDGAGTKLGQPTLAGASVAAKVISTVQGPKLVIQKFRRRKNFRRRTGHRQLHTRVQIENIVG